MHAKDAYEGIILEDGSVINNAVFRAMTPVLQDFVMETRGYIKQIEEIRSLEMLAPINPFTDLSNIPPAYLSSMADFEDTLMRKAVENLKHESIGFTEGAYVVNQLRQIKARTPEMNWFHSVKQMYGRFGIK